MDVLNKKINEEALGNEKNLEKIFEISENGIIIHKKGKIAYSNDVFVKLIGETEKKNIIGNSIFDYIKEEFCKTLDNTNKLEKNNKFINIKIIKKNKELIKVEAIGLFISFEKEDAILYFIRELSNRSQTEEKIEYIAYHDLLTGLPNKNLLSKYFSDIIKNPNKVKNNISVLFIDLDRFKNINDTLGHTFGDSVINEVTQKLINCIDENCFISRYGGDEFIVLIEKSNKSILSELAQKIVNIFSCPLLVDNTEMYITTSIGISTYPYDGEDYETLIKNADIALNNVKENGGNSYCYYSRDLSDKITRKMMIESGLRKALDNNELFLQYQPQYELETKELIGFEALLRWNHPKYGVIQPMEFIPIAEEIGLIIPIGRWVLEKACKQNKLWQLSGYPHVNISVNISGRQFQDKNFINIVRETLEETKLSPKYLELEITESIMQNINELNHVVNELRNLGVKLSIDDFGTGYSSLNILHKLPINTFKIDKSFISGITSNFDSESIIKTILDIGKNLNLRVVAEGIENKEQFKFLKKNNCNFGQGYYFSEPLDAEDIFQ